MKQLVLVVVLSGIAATGLSQARARKPVAGRVPGACRAITAETLSRALTLPEGCYQIDRFVNVRFPLTLSPGTTITFSGGAELAVDSNASLEATGSAEKPIILRGTDGTAGSWSGLSISSRSSHNRLSYVTIEDAGVKGRDNAAIVLAPGSLLGIDHSTVRRSLSSGIYVMDNAAFSRFEANHFTATDIPLRVKASDLASLDGASTFTGNTNNAVVVPFGEGKVDEKTVWRKLAVPYRFEASVDVGAALTIEPGTQLQFGESLPFNVVQNGSLTAIGTAAEPIVFTATDETPGYWSGIYFESASASNVLRMVEVRFSGSKNGVVGGGIGVAHQASATVQQSRILSCPVGIFVASEAKVNSDAASSNRFENVQQNVFVQP